MRCVSALEPSSNPAAPSPASPEAPGSEGANEPSSRPASHPLWSAVTLVLFALNLRAALTSVAPVLVEAIRDTGMSQALAGVLTTVPVLCLGLFGPLAPGLSRRFGMERTICGALLLLAAGTALRGLGTFSALLASAIITGASIGVGGVLLPGLVKRDFPQKASLMTGVYTMALCASAAIAAGLTVPLQRMLGGRWSAALAFWALPPLVAAGLWLPLALRRGAPAVHTTREVRGLWREPLAWQVTLFMGLQSSLAYIVFGWLAPILRDRGLSPMAAGLVVSGSVMFQLVAALGAPVLANRFRHQGFMVVVVMGLTLAGVWGCLYAPLDTLWPWAAVLGLGQGGSFALALALIVLRSPDSHVAAQLSSMAQSVGFLLAAVGPFAVGLLHGWTGTWASVGVLSLVVCVASTVFGIAAGRDRQVRVVSQPPRSR